MHCTQWIALNFDLLFNYLLQVQSVIQQNQASVIQSTALQTVHVGKSGNVIFLKGSPNSVIQSASGQHSIQGVQVSQYTVPLLASPSNSVSIGPAKHSGSSG